MQNRPEAFLDLPEPIGQSEAFLQFSERLSRLALIDRPILIIGERGSGKELAAARLHFLSPRWEGPFIHVNSAALAENLLESELFGHEAGSFTGALKRRLGRFEAADGGSLFLDEIGQTPLNVQEKVLRAVEYGKIQRLGANEETSVDARLIGATNADLPALVKKGQFKADLLDRLAFEVLRVPPLREREDDLERLAHHFARGMAVELGRETAPDFSPQALRQLREHSWPGNVRELKNVVERAVFWCEPEEEQIDELVLAPFPAAHSIEQEDAPADAHIPQSGPTRTTGHSPEGAVQLQPFKESCRAHELRLLRAALREARFNQRTAARLLHLTYHQFRGLYRKYREQLDADHAQDHDSLSQ